MTRLATICYIDNGKQLLMLHRNKQKDDHHFGKWISVGGKFEPGETPEECAIREIKEETGLTVKQMTMRGIIIFPEFTPEHDWYSYVFHVTEFEGKLIECDEGTLEWVNYEDVMSKPTWEGDYIFLQWVLDHSPFFSAKFVYQDEVLIDHTVTFYENIN